MVAHGRAAWWRPVGRRDGLDAVMAPCPWWPVRIVAGTGLLGGPSASVFALGAHRAGRPVPFGLEVASWLGGPPWRSPRLRSMISPGCAAAGAAGGSLSQALGRRWLSGRGRGRMRPGAVVLAARRGPSRLQDGSMPGRPWRAMPRWRLLVAALAIAGGTGGSHLLALDGVAMRWPSDGRPPAGDPGAVVAGPSLCGGARAAARWSSPWSSPWSTRGCSPSGRVARRSRHRRRGGGSGPGRGGMDGRARPAGPLMAPLVTVLLCLGLGARVRARPHPDAVARPHRRDPASPSVTVAVVLVGSPGGRGGGGRARLVVGGGLAGGGAWRLRVWRRPIRSPACSRRRSAAAAAASVPDLVDLCRVAASAGHVGGAVAGRGGTPSSGAVSPRRCPTCWTDEPG